MVGKLRAAVRIFSFVMGFIFAVGATVHAGVASNLRPRAAAARNTEYSLEDDLAAKKDGGSAAAILSGQYVNGGQQAIASLVQYRSSQYLKAVGAVGTADLFRKFKPGEFIDRELFTVLKSHNKATIAVNVVSFNEIEGHLLAAMENNAAIILELARSQIGYAIDEQKFVAYVKEVQERLGCTVPVCLHLDHNQYDAGLFDQQAILKAAYEEVNGKDSFDPKMDVNDIDMAILRKVQDKFRENAVSERKAVAGITERCLRAGLTSVAIDASTIFDTRAGDIVAGYYLTRGSAEEKLVARLEESFALPLEFGADFLKLDPATGQVEFERLKNEVVSELRKRNRPDEEINAKVKDVEAAFGILVLEARKAGLNPRSVIAAYDKIMKDTAQATIAGTIPAAILATVSEKEKMLLLSTNNVTETRYQLAFAVETSRKYNAKINIGKEAEVGHVDKKVPNPRRNGALEAKMTHPEAISLMEDRLTEAGQEFDIVAFNNGSGHGTDYDKKNLVPVSQVGKISPYLTAEIKRSSRRASPAQHGTSGSDMEELGVLAKAGVVKFNIATNNQQIQLNVHYLMQSGLRGSDLLKEVKANPDTYVNGLAEETRELIRKVAADFKEGRLTETIEDSDNSFIRFMKLTYAWGKKKSKIKESSSKEDISVVLAKEFKRGFKDMDGFLVAMGHLNQVKRIGVLAMGDSARWNDTAISNIAQEARLQGIEIVTIKAVGEIAAAGIEGLITLGDITGRISSKLQNDNPGLAVIAGVRTVNARAVRTAIGIIKGGLKEYKNQGTIGVFEVADEGNGFMAGLTGASVNAARTLVPEESVDLEQLVKDVKAYKAQHGYGVVIVSEGVTIDPAVGKNAELLASSRKGNQLSDPSEIVNSVLVFGGIRTDFEGKLDTLASTMGQTERNISVLLSRSAVNKIASGEKNQMVFVDSVDNEAMQPVSVELSDTSISRKRMDISEDGIDRAVYLQGNQALGVSRDGGAAVPAAFDFRQSFKGMAELYKSVCWTHWDLYARMQQPEFITLTPDQMQAWVMTLATFTGDEDWMWLRRIVRKVSPEQVSELKTMAANQGLEEAMDLALKDINMFVIAANARIFRAGAFADFVRNKEAGVNVVGIKSAKGKQELSAKDFVNHNSYLNKLFIGFKIPGMRMFPDQPVTIGGLETPAVRVPADRNTYRPGMVVPYFEASFTKEEEAAGKKAYDADEILDAYGREGIRIDVVLDYGDATERQITRMRPFAKRHIPMVLASPANKDGVRKMLAEYGHTNKNALVEALYGFNRHIVTADTDAVDSLTCTSNAMLNVLMAVSTNPMIEIQNIWGNTWHSATDSNSIFSEPSGRARQLIDWLRGVSILDNYLPAGTGAAKNLQVVIDSLEAGSVEEHQVRDLGDKTMIEAERTGTFVGSKYEIIIALKKPITDEQAKQMLREFAKNRSDGMVKFYEGVPGESDTPLDLNKIAGMPEVSIIDGLQCKVSKDGMMLVIKGYYDNQLAAPGQMPLRWAPRIVDARRAQQAIASRPASDGGVAIALSAYKYDLKVYGKFSQSFEDFLSTAAAVKAVNGALLISGKTVLENAGAVAALRAVRKAGVGLNVVVWSANADDVTKLKALNVQDAATIETKALPAVVSELNAKGIENRRMVVINAGTAAETQALVKDIAGIKAITVAKADSKNAAVNSMPLAVAKAVAIATSDEAVNEKFRKVAQEYKATVSATDFSKLEDLTSVVSEIPLITVETEISQAQAAYEEAVSRI